MGIAEIAETCLIQPNYLCTDAVLKLTWFIT